MNTKTQRRVTLIVRKGSNRASFTVFSHYAAAKVGRAWADAGYFVTITSHPLGLTQA